MCFEHRTAVRWLSGEQKCDRCQPIQTCPKRYLPPYFTTAEMLQKQRHVVPEIEVRLPRVPVSQRAGTEVVYDTGTTVVYLTARTLDLPAEIDLFHVCEEVFIQTTVLPISSGTYGHGC